MLSSSVQSGGKGGLKKHTYSEMEGRKTKNGGLREFISILIEGFLVIMYPALFSYRYQLEAFVDKVKGRQPTSWMDGEDSESNMEWIENVYERVWIFSSNGV